jgi:16S rRNA (adenine1518-N6/adenine1519-N6)-dimethyltransferase
MSAPVTTNQTISYLRRRFAEAGIQPGRKGQNFLIDLNLQRLIVEQAQLTASDVVLEVGTGTGALTALVAARAAAVVTVEIDPRLHQLASEELFELPNVAMLLQDALAGKNRVDERVVRAVRDALGAGGDRRLKLVANLPYNVATPLVANLLISSIVPRSMTVTVQKEVADRIAARSSTKDYGSLSVWIQSQCHVELVRTLAPSVFWPRPKVTSAIVHVEVDESRRQAIGDLQFFHEFVRALFAHRRKFLRGTLHGAWKGRLGKAGLDAVLAEAGLRPDVRAEQLGVDEILALSRAVGRALGC